MNATPRFKVLFLCTGNSARSILAEFILRKLAGDRFEVWSAGSQPRGTVHPLALRVLSETLRIDPTGARSKSLAELAGIDFDFVITLCDHAQETCPVWPQRTVVAHWGSPDPAAFVGGEEDAFRFFFAVASQIQRRIELMCNLPLATLDQARRERLTRGIGQQEKLPGQT